MADKITSTYAKESDGNIQITFTIPFEVIKIAQDETVAEMSKDIEVPGFRKGNAPLDKVKAKISQNTLIEHSLSHILPKALAEAINEHKLKLAIYPKFELISAEEGKEWQIRGITCELPEIDLGDYKKAVAGENRASKLTKEPTREEKENVAIKALLTSAKMTIPSVLIEEEVTSRLSNLLSRIEKLGLSLDSYLASIGKTVESLRGEYEAQAKDAITLDITLTKIATDENITVDPKEIDSALTMSVTSAGKLEEHPEELENRKRMLESILKRRKALDFLISLS
jgi:FKBP-type peptidyl-prolyl cis-trans isomerase (trigger factor)